jgi:hypothetical protein
MVACVTRVSSQSARWARGVPGISASIAQHHASAARALRLVRPAPGFVFLMNRVSLRLMPLCAIRRGQGSPRIF